MAHYVTCIYCKQQFNRDKEATHKISERRYAHQKCFEEHEANKSQEEKDLDALEKYVMKLFDEPFVNARVKKQIKDFQQTYHYTYSGMLKTLIWWYEIKGNSTELSNGGIGIIPFIYQQACDYYYALYLAQIANEEKDVKKYTSGTKEINIFSPRAWIQPPHLFDLGEDEDGE